uniref:WAP four-disulfide core domain 2 n=1 Tax=Oryzias latipes TaxID=8090 RepID=A0A3P9KY02_ORYLA
PVHVWVFCRNSSFLPQSKKTIHEDVCSILFVCFLSLRGPKLGHCPSYFVGPGSEGSCKWDRDCPNDYKCCVFRNKATCVPPIVVEQVCPDTTGMIGICVELCGLHGYCPNGELCCSNGCGHVCTTPITVKPGDCPDPRFTRQCGTRCSHDGQCPGEMKCCQTSCGQVFSEFCSL